MDASGNDRDDDDKEGDSVSSASDHTKTRRRPHYRLQIHSAGGRDTAAINRREIAVLFFVTLFLILLCSPLCVLKIGELMDLSSSSSSSSSKLSSLSSFPESLVSSLFLFVSSSFSLSSSSSSSSSLSACYPSRSALAESGWTLSPVCPVFFLFMCLLSWKYWIFPSPQQQEQQQPRH